MESWMRLGEGSASDEAWEGAGKAKRSPVPTQKFGGVVMENWMRLGEGSASDELWEGAGKAKRSPVPTQQGVAL